MDALNCSTVMDVASPGYRIFLYVLPIRLLITVVTIVLMVRYVRAVFEGLAKNRLSLKVYQFHLLRLGSDVFTLIMFAAITLSMVLGVCLLENENHRKTLYTRDEQMNEYLSEFRGQCSSMAHP